MTVYCVFVIVLSFQKMQDLLSRVVLMFFSQKMKRDHFLCLTFFWFVVSLFSLFLLWFVLENRVLFADFAALEKILVRSNSFPIFAWRKCLRQDQAQVEELTRFLNMPLDQFSWLVVANYTKKMKLVHPWVYCQCKLIGSLPQ